MESREYLERFMSSFSPFIGLLGSFMTGSNMSSNILFAGFQSTTANLLEVHSAICSWGAVIGAHRSEARFSPSNIVLGTTTANILGSEGKVLRKIIVITVPAALMIGVFCTGADQPVEEDENGRERIFSDKSREAYDCFLYYHGGICPHAERATFKQRHLMSRRVSFDSGRFALLPDGRTSVCAFKKR